MKELEQFLTDRAMEHDSPTLLFNLAREYLMSAKVIRPGAITLAKMVGAARAAAGELASHKVAHLLTQQVRSDLALLLKVDAGLGCTRLEWLTKPETEASATAVKTSIDKLAWLRAMDADQLDLSVLPSHSASTSSSARVDSRNPSASRTWARCRSIDRPDQSYSASNASSAFTWPAT